MNPYHLIKLAEKIYNGIVNYQVYNPHQVNNACYLIGYFPQNDSEKLFMRNVLLNYFMNNLMVVRDNLKYTEPTPEELSQLKYIESHWSTEDLGKYIKAIDDDMTFNATALNAIGLLFTSADDAEPQINELPEIKEEEKKLPNVEVKLEAFNEDKPKRGRPRSK
jgi:hypothetical protein